MSKPSRFQPGKPSHFSAPEQVSKQHQLHPAREPKIATVPQKPKLPIAPPVYRPQPIPKVLQRKMATCQPPPAAKAKPAAPPVYRPQSVPKVLQRKVVQGQSATDNLKISQKRPVAPPVYRPQPVPKVLQTKTADRQPSLLVNKMHRPPVAPPAYRPQPRPPGIPAKAATSAKPTGSPARYVPALKPGCTLQAKPADFATFLETNGKVLIPGIKIGFSGIKPTKQKTTMDEIRDDLTQYIKMDGSLDEEKATALIGKLRGNVRQWLSIHQNEPTFKKDTWRNKKTAMEELLKLTQKEFYELTGAHDYISTGYSGMPGAFESYKWVVQDEKGVWKETSDYEKERPGRYDKKQMFTQGLKLHVSIAFDDYEKMLHRCVIPLKSKFPGMQYKWAPTVEDYFNLSKGTQEGKGFVVYPRDTDELLSVMQFLFHAFMEYQINPGPPVPGEAQIDTKGYFFVRYGVGFDISKGYPQGKAYAIIGTDKLEYENKEKPGEYSRMQMEKLVPKLVSDLNK